MNEAPSLRVDVEAEIRKLSLHRFKTDGAAIVDIVRAALGLGASRIRMQIGWRGFSLQCSRATLPEPIANGLLALLDPSRPPEARHRALLALEETDGFGLLAAFARKPGRVVMEWSAEDFSRGVVFSKNRPVKRYRAGDVDGLFIAVYGPLAGRRKAISFVERHLRYCAIPITANGRPIGGPLRVPDCLIQVEARNEHLRGSVGLPAHADLVRVERLRNQVLIDEVVLPAESGLVFSAVVEEKDGDFDATLATLKRTARKLYFRLASRYGDIEAPARPRAEDLLFERYRNTFETGLLEGVPVFTEIGGLAVDYFTLKKRAKDRPIWIVDFDAPLDAYDLGSGIAFRLTRRQRQFLEADPAIKLALPPPQSRGPGLRFGVTARLKASLSGWRSRFGRSPGIRISDDQLAPTPARFLEAVRSALASGHLWIGDRAIPAGAAVWMAEGQRQPWLQISEDPPEYAIALDHPDVDAAAAAFERDDSNLYPALALLTRGQAAYRTGEKQAVEAILGRHFANAPRIG